MAEEEKKASIRFDEYWMEKGRTIVDGTLEGLEKRHKRLMEFLNYLGGGTFIAGTTWAAVMGTTNPLVYLFFALPLVAIVVTKYQIGVELTNPDFGRFDIRSPLQIQNFYNSLVNSRREKLRQGQQALQLILGLVVICYPLGLWFHNLDKAETKTTDPVEILSYETSTRVKGQFDDSQQMIVQFFGQPKDTFKTKSVEITKEIKKDEKFDLYFRHSKLTLIPESIRIEYLDDELKKTIEKPID